MSSGEYSGIIGEIVAFATGSSTSVADAANAAQQAVAARETPEKIVGTATAANDLFAVVTGGMQRILQEFAPSSAKATQLLGNAGNSSALVGLELSALPITTAVLNGEPGKITTGQLDALSGAALLTGAVLLPQAAVVLTVLGSLMIAASIIDNNEANNLSNAVARLRRLIQPYHDQLPASSRAALTSAMSAGMESTLSGGFLVPNINGSGRVIGYTAELPTSVSNDGSNTRYTFKSGCTYVIGHVTDDDPLIDPLAVTGKSVWTIPGGDSPEPMVLDIHHGGTYSSRFVDLGGDAVTEIYISGSSGNYVVVPMSGGYQFVHVAGEGNEVVIHGDRNDVSLADRNTLLIDGAANQVRAYANTVIEFGVGEGNSIENAITGEKLDVSGGYIHFTSGRNGGCGGEDVLLGASNRLRLGSDGSKTLTLRYDGNERVYCRTYNSQGVQTDLLVLSPDGSYGNWLFDPVSGLTIKVISAAADGSGMVMKYNAAQQLVEQDYIRADGSGSQFIKDPLTGQTTVFSTRAAVFCRPYTVTKPAIR